MNKVLVAQFSERVAAAEVVLHYHDGSWVGIHHDRITVHWSDDPGSEGVIVAGFTGAQMEHWVRIQRLIFQSVETPDHDCADGDGKGGWCW